MRINQNLPGLISYNAFAANNTQLQKSIQRLSTGLRINSAADEAAGLAISEKMSAQIHGLEQAVRNAQDGSSMIQTAEGALGEAHSILQRMRELSVQAANDTLTADDRSYIQLEIEELKEEIDRIASTTQFNRKTLLDGSADALWSSDRLSTTAFINGPLEREGNYKIRLEAVDAGQGEVQKTNILREKRELYIDNYIHGVEVESVTLDVPQGELASVDNLGFSLLTYQLSGSEIFGTVSIGGVNVTFNGEDAATANTMLQNALAQPGNGLCYISINGTTKGCYSVTDDTLGYGAQEPGPPIDVSWNLSGPGDGNFALYHGDRAVLAENARQSSTTHTIDDSQADVTGITWNPARENNMLPGTYYVDLCPQGLLSAAVGTVITAPGKNPFLFNQNTIRAEGPDEYNMSIAFEVTSIHDHEGFESVAFSYYFVQIDTDGNVLPTGSGSFVVDLNDPSSGLIGRDFNGVSFTQLDISRDISQYTIGDKFCVTTAADPDYQIAISSDRTPSSGGYKTPFVNYTFNQSRFNGTPIDMPFYQIDGDGNIVLSNVSVSAKWPLSHNHSSGRDTPYAAKFTIADTGTTTSAEFQQARITCTLDRQRTGRYYETTADLDATLRSLAQFYDANGRFLLEQPKTLTIRQGGATGTITLYADDTMADLLDKLNDSLLQADGGERRAASFLERSELLALADAFGQVGAMAIDDTMVQNTLQLASKKEASALKLLNGTITLDALQGLKGTNATYLAALRELFEDPAATDEHMIQSTGVSAAEAANLRAIKGKSAYTTADIAFLTGLSADDVARVAALWNTRNDFDYGTNVANVPGTIVLRAARPGNAGRISVAGDEDLVRALGLNTLQEAEEATYRATVTDAHSGKTVVSGCKFAGNTLHSAVDPNVDVTFDPTAGIDVEWNENTRQYTFKEASESYETYVHLADNATVLQVGANEKEEMRIAFGNISARALGIRDLDVTTRESAARAISLIDNAIGEVSAKRARLGAYLNRLEHTVTNLTTGNANMQASQSRIRDTDMAKEMMEFTKLSILSQAGTSLMAQSNQLPQNVLSLLQ